MHELHDDYPESLAIIAWHTGDEFEFTGSTNRTNFWGVTGFPTVWFDGYMDVVGGYQPSSYPYYVPVMEERVPWPSNFEVDMVIGNTDATEYTVDVTIDIKNGNSTENLAGFIVLTETDVISPGNEDQAWVARSVFPEDGNTGYPLDYSSATSHTFGTTITIEDTYVHENCEVIAFIQNMDTKEIYQATSLMATDITIGVDEQLQGSQLEVYPNPASDRVNIKADSKIENVQVFSHNGQLVYETKAGSNILNLNTAQFEAGLYLFRVQTATGVVTESVVIE